MSLKDDSDERPEILSEGFWNYRVVKRGEYLGIYEAYYDTEGKVRGLTVDPVGPEGEDLDQLKTALTLMLEALEDGVLDYEQIISK